MLKAAAFSPDWASAPGDTISDVLDERGISLDHFASEMQFSRDFATNLIVGEEPITPNIASNLERHLGATASFWLSRDFQYRKQLTRLMHRQHQ